MTLSAAIAPAGNPSTGALALPVVEPINPRVEEFIDYERDLGRAPTTLRVRRSVLSSLVRHLAHRAGVPPDEPDLLLIAELEDLQDWAKSIRSATTASSYSAQVRSFYRWATSQKSGPLLTVNPAEYLVAPRMAEARRRRARTNPLVIDYIEHERSNRRAEATLRLKHVVLGHLVAFLASHLKAEPDDPSLLLAVDLADLQAWKRTLTMQDSSAATYTSQVRAFFGWLAGAAGGRRLAENPAELLFVPDRPNAVPHPIPDEDLWAALDLAAASDERMYAWLLLASSTGMRCCEIAKLERRDIVINEQMRTARITIRESKGKKTRVRDAGPALVAALRPFLARSGPLFTCTDLFTGRRVQIRRELVSNYIARFMHNVAGITDTAHSLRHWFGTAVYATTRDIRATQEALGHASPTTTAGYAAVVDGHGGRLGLTIDKIVDSRGQVDPREANFHPVAAPAGHGPEQHVVRLRAEGHSWATVAEMFDITEDDARNVVRRGLGIAA